MGWKKALAILATTPVFLIIFPSGVYKRLLSLLNSKDSSIVIRSRVWDASMETLKEKWVWGLGPGVGNVRDILVNQYHINQPHAHNLFLQLYLEGGIIGGTLFALIVLWVLVDMVILSFRSKEGRPLAVAIIASLAGFLTCGVTDYVLYGPKILQYFMMLLGLSLAVKKIYRTKKTNES
jgi:O-antigen ligase